MVARHLLYGLATFGGFIYSKQLVYIFEPPHTHLPPRYAGLKLMCTRKILSQKPQNPAICHSQG